VERYVLRGRRHRYVRVRGGFSHRDRAGTNRFRFTGRLGRRTLAPGRYRLVAVANDGAGQKSATRRTTFRVVP
jgi:hypothetical protein